MIYLIRRMANGSRHADYGIGGQGTYLFANVAEQKGYGNKNLDKKGVGM